MRVSVVTGGRFHAVDLAVQLEKTGVLHRLHTALPRIRVESQLRPKTDSVLWPLFLNSALTRVTRIGHRFNARAIAAFDSRVCARLEPSDVVHAMSGFGLRCHVEAKRRWGAVTVCDRGSSHILAQAKLLREEYERWGLQFEADTHLIERELTEYEVCDRIVVPSTFVQQSFVRQGIAKQKISVIPYGVDLHMFRPAPGARRRNARFQVIFVGLIGLRKGLPYLLEAYSLLRIPNAELLLIGPEAAEANSILARFKVDATKVGTISREHLCRYYSSASVLVLPSIEEGLALVQAQAMACGLPVIATENTGAHDLFTDGQEGFIVPARSASAIAEKLQLLAEDEQMRRDMGEAARRRVASRGGWSTYGSLMTAMYRSQLGLAA